MVLFNIFPACVLICCRVTDRIMNPICCFNISIESMANNTSKTRVPCRMISKSSGMVDGPSARSYQPGLDSLRNDEKFLACGDVLSDLLSGLFNSI